MASDAQKKIAEMLDETAREAEAMGYPETAKNFEKRAAEYRTATGQPASGQQDADGQ